MVTEAAVFPVNQAFSSDCCVLSYSGPGGCGRATDKQERPPVAGNDDSKTGVGSHEGVVRMWRLASSPRS